ncbi:DNRLRE domain-containing protein [Nocardioides speluncae]|uniref:DNRLRE domain-containing protein n=1 Tax=Nocardioides speluncae TaxID=2670337 RepID=UPI000D68AC27|nr:DNRLRE domain-containing protein [Nocardioides speluncae]
MTTITVRKGYDTYVTSTLPNKESGDAKYPRMITAVARTLLFINPGRIKGRTVLSATLIGRAAGNPAWIANTVSVQRLTASWSAKTANWTNQPGVTGTIATEATGALAPGDVVEIDVTTLIQQIANGNPNYGWRITTDSATTHQWRGFDQPFDSWELVTVLSDAPEQPVQLNPGGGVVAKDKPTLSWDFIDFGGNTEQAAFQVQIDPAQNGTTPAFASGTVTSPDPEYNLATSAYLGIGAGNTTWWRVRVQDGAGLWSAWSDWVSMKFVAKPTLIIDNPGIAGVLFDPTSDILAHIASGVLTQYRIKITGPSKAGVRYDTGWRPATHATNIAHTLPLRNANGLLILKDDSNYQVGVFARDSQADREGSIGDFPHMEEWRTFTFDDDDLLTAPNSLTAVQVGKSPQVKLTWNRAAAPDAWVVRRDGVVIARPDPSDVIAPGGGVYEWTDDGYAAPHQQHSYTVRAVVNQKQSPPSNTANVTTKVEGVWLITEAHQAVKLRGVGVEEWAMRERRATYAPLGSPVPVDIIYAQEGLSGPFKGWVHTEPVEDISLTVALARLQDIKDAPTDPVWLVAADMAIKVRLRNLTFSPHPDTNPKMLRHQVAFEFWQVDHTEIGFQA